MAVLIPEAHKVRARAIARLALYATIIYSAACVFVAVKAAAMLRQQSTDPSTLLLNNQIQNEKDTTANTVSIQDLQRRASTLEEEHIGERLARIESKQDLEMWGISLLFGGMVTLLADLVKRIWSRATGI